MVALDLLDPVRRQRAGSDRLRIGLPVADVFARQLGALVGGDDLSAAHVAPGALLPLAAPADIGGADRHLRGSQDIDRGGKAARAVADVARSGSEVSGVGLDALAAREEVGIGRIGEPDAALGHPLADRLHLAELHGVVLAPCRQDARVGRAGGQLRGAGRVDLDLADRLGGLLGLQLERVSPRVERVDLGGKALRVRRHVRVASVAALTDDVHRVGGGSEARGGALDPLRPLEVV